MSTAVFGAPEFKARSGRAVRPQEDGSVRFELAHGYVDRNTAMDAEEFFQAKRDAELGRWRWPENPHYVVYPRRDGAVLVLNEMSVNGGILYRRGDRIDDMEAEAAYAYFETHPERKPWHDAVHGEVWAVTETNGEALYRVTAWGRFEQVSGDDGLLSFPVSHVSITDARRVWPEDAS